MKVQEVIEAKERKGSSVSFFFKEIFFRGLYRFLVVKNSSEP